MRSNLSKLKYFTDHFFWKVFTLSIICNYFPLGVAVSASLGGGGGGKPRPRSVRRPSGRATYPSIRPGARRESQSWDPSSQTGFYRAAAGAAILDTLQKAGGRAPSLPPSKAAVRPGRARRWLGKADPSPALTIAAPRPARDSRPTPSSNRAAAQRRLRRASPAGLRRAQQWAARPRPAPPRRGQLGRAAAGGWFQALGTRRVPGRPTTTPSRCGGRAGGAALARRSPPGNPTGSLPDWPGRSGRDLHVNGRESSLRFENGRVRLASAPRGVTGSDAHIHSPSFTSSQLRR